MEIFEWVVTGKLTRFFEKLTWSGSGKG